MSTHTPHPASSLQFPTGTTAKSTSESHSLIEDVWADRRLGVLISSVIAATTGVIVAVVMPWGPITTAHALMLIGIGLLTGIASGVLFRSRRGMLLAPLSNLLAFEIGRRGTDAATVDGLHLESTFGILAMILSRGFYLLLGLVPMMLGVLYGLALARRLAHDPGRSHRRRLGFYVRRGCSSLATLGVIAVAVLIALPASTPAITDAKGEKIAGSVAELTKVPLGGHDQWILVRGQSVDKPVLLWLDGGPGQSGLAFTRALFADLEQDFVVVDWDQRGVGKSYPALEPAATLTLDQAVADTTELTNYLRQRFDEEKIYIGGESWGTTLGVLAVQQHPELYYAYLGSGQMVSQRETDLQIYRDLMAYAERTGNDGIASKLREFGEPPYADVWAYGYIMQHYEDIESDYDPPAYYDERGENSGIGPWGLFASEYTFVEKVNVLRGLIDVFAVMYPQLQDIDFRRDVPRLDVPVYIFDGEHELNGRRALALEWYGQLQAPIKRIYTFEQAGHAPAREEFRAFHQVLIETVVPETYPPR